MRGSTSTGNYWTKGWRGGMGECPAAPLRPSFPVHSACPVTPVRWRYPRAALCAHPPMACSVPGPLSGCLRRICTHPRGNPTMHRARPATRGPALHTRPPHGPSSSPADPLSTARAEQDDRPRAVDADPVGGCQAESIATLLKQQHDSPLTAAYPSDCPRHTRFHSPTVTASSAQNPRAAFSQSTIASVILYNR